MKKLFGDNIISKLRGIPSFVWVLLVYVSFFFANAYGFLLNGEYAAMYSEAAYAELGYTINTASIGVIAAIMEPLVPVILLEAILAFSYNTVAGRYRASLNRKDYKFRVRYLVILLNTVIGVLSIGYFFTQTINGVPSPNISLFSGFNNSVDAENPYYTIQSNLLPYAVTAAFCLLFYEDFRVRFVPKKNQAPMFATFSMLFVGIYALVFAFDLLSAFVFYTDVTLTVYEIVAYSVKGGLIAISAVVFFLYYRKLKKEKDDEFTVEIFPPDDFSSGSTTEKIYDDFDF